MSFCCPKPAGIHTHKDLLCHPKDCLLPHQNFPHSQKQEQSSFFSIAVWSREVIEGKGLLNQNNKNANRSKPLVSQYKVVLFQQGNFGPFSLGVSGQLDACLLSGAEKGGGEVETGKNTKMSRKKKKRGERKKIFCPSFFRRRLTSSACFGSGGGNSPLRLSPPPYLLFEPTFISFSIPLLCGR